MNTKGGIVGGETREEQAHWRRTHNHSIELLEKIKTKGRGEKGQRQPEKKDEVGA